MMDRPIFVIAEWATLLVDINLAFLLLLLFIITLLVDINLAFLSILQD